MRSTAHGFPISSSSLSNARGWTRLDPRECLVVNLAMAVWMKQDPVGSSITAPIDSPHDVMAMPSCEGGNLLVADRTETMLFPPEMEQLSSPFQLADRKNKRPFGTAPAGASPAAHSTTSRSAVRSGPAAQDGSGVGPSGVLRGREADGITTLSGVRGTSAARTVPLRPHATAWA